MSLTRLIEEPEVKVRLNKLIRRPDFDGKRKLLAAPRSTRWHRTLVGTAFDYLFRFYLKRVNPQAVERGHWVAENAAFCTGCLAWHPETDRMEIVPQVASELMNDPHKHKLALKMQSIINEAKENYQLYLKTGTVTEKLLRSAIGLAKLDVITRTDRQPDLVDLADIDKRDVDDLQQLVNVIPASNFKPRTVCVLNPTFGQGSELGVGADADVIIGDTLIDVKTVIKCRLLSKYLHQLVGYYCLYLIGGVNGVPADKPLRRVGLYFSRHSYLYTVTVTDCCRPSDLKAFLSWFEQLLRSRAISTRSGTAGSIENH